jgi:pimeloyl-ACP methyl ester carboxylesterase
MTPLVLIPGMMCDARLYGPQIPALSARRPVLLAPCTEHDTIAALAAAILAVAPPRFALAGLSLGGIVAMEILRQAGERVERLALLDTNPRAELPDVRERRTPQVARVAGGALEAVMREDVMPSYLAKDSPEDILDLCLEMALALGPQVFANQSRALASRPDQETTLAAYRGPALVLMGAEDRLCPLDRHELMHRLMPQSRLVVVQGAGHLPTLEKPERTTAELIRWLDDR